MTMTRPQPPRPDARVIVVEDEPRLRELLQRAMANWGFEVAVARSGEEAIRLSESDPADIAVLDLNLPGMDGLELLARLRAKTPGVQAIVVTGFASLEAAQKAVHLDVVEFLTKPCHLGELEKALDRALRRLPPAYPAAGAPQTPSAEGMTLQEVERQHILATLDRQNGNRTATAAELGISRRTLYYKLEEYQKQGFNVG
ncbi:MAG TPA: response regulator [Tepidisphaeraceae bacterium]|jgi:DNA-binding NtrC family response regulator|nr:response regulator [Tepidisphaeraceae bacterium]